MVDDRKTKTIERKKERRERDREIERERELERERERRGEREKGGEGERELNSIEFINETFRVSMFVP